MGFGCGTIILIGSIVIRSSRHGIPGWRKAREFHFFCGRMRRSRLSGETISISVAAEKAFVALTRPITDGGVLFEDDESNLWIEEYLVSPPTHILNGFIWALWGVFDYWLATEDTLARKVFDRGVQTLLQNLARFDTGYWSLYELSGTRMKMLASPFYHQLHSVQLRILSTLTGRYSLCCGCRAMGKLCSASQQSDPCPG